MKFLSKLSMLSMSNPFVILVSVIFFMIIVLSILRAANMSLGLGVNAHLGQLRGSFSIEGFESGEPALVMYYADWCGHCKRTKPQLERAREQYRGPVKIVMLDGDSDENKPLLKQEGVKGFPTIRYYAKGCPFVGSKGTGVEYNGERTTEGFVEYLNSI